MQLEFKDELLARGRLKRTMFMTVDTNVVGNAETRVQTEDFVQWLRVNQARLTPELRQHYDFIVCGSGSSGSVLNTYRRIEDWHGAPDPKYRGTGGPVFVQPVPDPSPACSGHAGRNTFGRDPNL
jgi:hypothetical protein